MSNENNHATFKVAAVRATPVFLNREATTDKACDLIAAAGSEGRAWLSFQKRSSLPILTGYGRFPRVNSPALVFA